MSPVWPDSGIFSFLVLFCVTFLVVETFSQQVENWEAGQVYGMPIGEIGPCCLDSGNTHLIKPNNAHVLQPLCDSSQEGHLIHMDAPITSSWELKLQPKK